MKKLVILLSVFTLTACSTQSKPVEHKEKHKVVKVKKKKTTQPSSSSSSSSSSTAPSSSSETQTQTAPVEQAPAQYTQAPAPAQSQPQAGTGGAYIDGQGTWTEQDKTNETAPSATPSQQWHDDQVQWAQDQGLIDQNGNPTNGQ